MSKGSISLSTGNYAIFADTKQLFYKRVNMKSTKQIQFHVNKYVWVVLDYPFSEEPVIHGVYTTKEIADNVANAQKYKQGFSCGYIAVLKFRVKGIPQWS